MSEPLKFVGESPSRIDGLEKITGAATYVDDLAFGPNLLHAEIVESPHAHALIRRIDTSAAERVPGVVRVVTGKDFPYRFGLYMQDRLSFRPTASVSWASRWPLSSPGMPRLPNAPQSWSRSFTTSLSPFST